MSESQNFIFPDGFACHGKRFKTNIRGLNLSYLKYENPNKPVIVMLHGFMDFSHSFDLLANELKDDYEIYVWDARGFGDTDWVHESGYYHFAEYVYDLDLFLNFINQEKYILVGHSMGGIIASLYSSIFPEKISHLINLEGWFFRNPKTEEAPKKMKDWIVGIKNNKPSTPMKNLAEASDRLLKNDPFMTEEISLHLAHEGTKIIDDRYYWKHDSLHKTVAPTLTNIEQIKEFLKKITIPTLLLKGNGQKNIFLNNSFVNGESFFPDAKIVEIENAGHNLHLHQPEKIANLIKDFLFY